MPRQLPPLTSGPPPGRASRQSRAARIPRARPSPPAFSSSPPGMTMIDSAASRSATSATIAAARAAERATTKRSTFAGSEATSGTQRQPSSEATPGLTTTMRSGSNPSRMRLRRIVRPGLSPLETPAIAIDAGSRRRGSFQTGRSAVPAIATRAGVPARPASSVTRTSRATGPSGVTARGLISRSRMPPGPHSGREGGQSLDDVDEGGDREQRGPATLGLGGEADRGRGPERSRQLGRRASGPGRRSPARGPVAGRGPAARHARRRRRRR